MTENEAIKVLKDEHSYGYELNEACLIAIKALEEIQQYRAIGTVDEIKSEHKELIKLSRRYLKDTNELIKYQENGTVEEFKNLKEKNNKDFELLLKCVKDSYPMFKGAYVELDVFMGNIMRRFARDRKET